MSPAGEGGRPQTPRRAAKWSPHRQKVGVRWVVDVVGFDLEKLWAAAAKKKTENRRLTNMRLEWQPTGSLKPYPPEASASSEELKEEGSKTDVVCHWVVDGTLKLKHSEVCQSQLLWIALRGPPVLSRRQKASYETKVLGKVYLDLANYTPGKYSKQIQLTGDMFDLVVRVHAMTQDENPDMVGDGPSKSLAVAMVEGPPLGAGGLISDHEPQDPAAQRRWLQDERQKLRCELRRSMMELNRETVAALQEHEAKQKELAALKKREEDLNRQMEVLRNTAGVFDEKKRSLQEVVRRCGAEAAELEVEYDELQYRLQLRRQQCCAVM
eukprot:EG_transcript_7577